MTQAVIRLVLFAIALTASASGQTQTFWESTNGPTGGTTQALTFNSTGALIAGTGGTGVFVLLPGDSNWIPSSAGLNNPDVRALLTLPGNIVLAGTGLGVFRSTNGGQSWNTTGLDFGINNAFASISGSDVVVGTTNGNAGVLRSIDGGLTWGPAGLSGFSVIALAYRQLSNTLFAGTTTSGIFRSTNAGTSWIPASNGLTDSVILSIAVSSSGVVFAGTANGQFRSLNNGATWVPVGAGISAGPRYAVVVNQARHVFLGTGITSGVFRSTDDGTSWAAVNSGLTNLDIRSLVLSPGGVLHAGTGNGTVFRSTSSTVPPVSPVLISPADQSINQPINILLRWTASSGAADYLVQVATDSQFTSVIVSDTLTTTTKTVGPLANGTTYFWRVSARNLGGTSAFSARRFTTIPVTASVPILLIPIDNATNIPSPVGFRWRASNGASTYRFQLSTDSTFSFVILDDSTIVDTVFQTSALVEATTYFWRVSARNVAGSSAFSFARRFRTAGVPAMRLIPPMIDFGSVTLGSSVSDTVTILSEGSDPLVVDSVRIVGVDASEFSVLGSQGPFPPIDPQNSIQVVVRYVPTVTGPRTAFLSVWSNASPAIDSVTFFGRSTAPVLEVTISGTPVQDGTVGFGVKIPASTATLTESLYVRNAGQTSYSSLELTQITPDSFFVQVPPAFLNIRGVEYYVVIVDGTGFPLTYPELNPAGNPAILRVSIANALSLFTLPRGKYRMASVPLELGQTGLLNLFSDDFGPYQRNLWRLFRWENGAYAEAQQVSAAAAPGSANWVVVHAGGNFDTDSGRSVNSATPYVITLPASDWSQIGNPFAFPVEWQSIISSGNVRGPYYFNGESYILDTNAVMRPWEGYFVFNEEAFPVTLTIPVLEAPEPPRPPRPIAPGEFMIRLTAASWEEPEQTSQIFVGSRYGATSGYDLYDYPAPPRSPANEATLAIVSDGREFMINAKPASQLGNRWDVRVSVPPGVNRLRAEVSSLGNLPDGHHSYIYDIHDRAVIGRENSTFVIESASASRELIVIVGTDEFARQILGDVPLKPIVFNLLQNFPNPFNPSTTIEYHVAKRANVSIEVFNVLGQQVRTLLNEDRNAGFHSIIWDGVNNTGSQMSSGVYVYRMTAGQFVQHRKLILLR